MANLFYVDITGNLINVPFLIDDINKKLITQAARYAINRALITTRKEAIKEVQKYRRLKTTVLKTQAEYSFNLIKARGSKLSTLRGQLVIPGAAFPLMLFVRGSKDPRPQKGIKIKRRRTLKFEVLKGKSYRMPTMFIARVRSKQVFTHIGTGRRVRKQTVPGIANIFSKNQYAYKTNLVRTGTRRFQEEFIPNLQRRIDGSIKTFNGSMGSLKKMR